MQESPNKNEHIEKLDEEMLSQISAAGNCSYYKIGSVDVCQGANKEQKYFTVVQKSGFQVVGIPDEYIEKLDELKSRTAKLFGDGGHPGVVNQDLIDKYNEALGDTGAFSSNNYIKGS